MNSHFERLKKTSRICELLLTFALLAFSATYLANLACTLAIPQARIIGWSDLQQGPHGYRYEAVGLPRMFLTPTSPDYTLILDIHGSRVPWQSPTSPAILIYLLYITLFTAVWLKGLNHLRKLFAQFAIGHVFTPTIVLELQRLGHTVLWGAAITFLGSILLIVIGRILEAPIQSRIDIPFWPLIAGFLISLIASIFAEGQRLNDEAQLTI